MNEKSLIELDEILNKNKFDFIIDGMNVYYASGFGGLKNITQLVHYLQRFKEKNILILFQTHIKKRIEKNSNLDFMNLLNVKCFYTTTEYKYK